MAFRLILHRSRTIALAVGLCAFAIGPTGMAHAQADQASSSFSENENPAVVAGKAWLEVNKIPDAAEFE